jgi:S-methylmethionine-dependent homocysteine/selenocysteine methylase
MTPTPLPQLRGDGLFITDGGLETDLIHHHGFDLPCFASFPLLAEEEGTQALRDYYARYIEIAREHGVGLLLDTVTWRANPDWGEELGYSPADLEAANRRAVALAMEIRDAVPGEPPILITGVVGPRGDAYSPDELMTADEAARYHAPQIATLADAGVDFITALTLTYSAEAIGIARAAAPACPR